jgi:hypothetical protein
MPEARDRFVGLHLAPIVEVSSWSAARRTPNINLLKRGQTYLTR